MTVVNALSSLMEWLEDKVCPLVSLKLPSEADGSYVDDASYDFKTVNPSVLGMYWPTSRELLPPDVRDVQPGMLVQIVGGDESYSESTTRVTVRIHLSAWNPGRHAQDVWTKLDGSPRWVRSEGRSFCPGYDDGWRDAWNFLDTVLREVRNAPVFRSGASIDREAGVKFGPYESQGSIVDFYPYFFAWLEIQVKQPQGCPASLSELL